MSQLARLLGVFSVGHVLEHGGRSYEFRRVDQAMKTRLEGLFFKRCREGVYAQKDELTEGEFDRQLGRVTDAYNSGEYSFPVGRSLEWFAGEGIAQLVEVMTGCTPAEAQSLCADRWQETFHLVWCVISESSPALKKRLLQAEAAGGKQALAMRTLAAQLALTSGRATTPAPVTT